MDTIGSYDCICDDAYEGEGLTDALQSYYSRV